MENIVQIAFTNNLSQHFTRNKTGSKIIPVSSQCPGYSLVESAESAATPARLCFLGCERRFRPPSRSHAYRSHSLTVVSMSSLVAFEQSVSLHCICTKKHSVINNPHHFHTQYIQSVPHQFLPLFIWPTTFHNEGHDIVGGAWRGSLFISVCSRGGRMARWGVDHAGRSGF